jgi:acyl-CoA reductase-like NAD-dependent aldehyde dehydrogenase
MSSIQTVPLLVGGRFENSVSDRCGDVFNPSSGKVQAKVPFCTAEEIDRAVHAAAGAQPAWGETPAVERARVMFRFRELMQARFEELAALITREHGKTLAEARAEMQRGVEMVEFACGIPSLLMGQSLANLAASVDCETTRHPVGVCVGITPFNFPAMVPLWMFPVAIACGNTFILKPSEKVPLSAMKLGELLTEAGLPPAGKCSAAAQSRANESSSAPREFSGQDDPASAIAAWKRSAGNCCSGCWATFRGTACGWSTSRFTSSAARSTTAGQRRSVRSPNPAPRREEAA